MVVVEVVLVVVALRLKVVVVEKKVKEHKEAEIKTLRDFEVEFCYVDDERQRRNRFNENRRQRRSA